MITAVESAPASAKIAPTERSIPPVMMTIVIPTPMIVFTEVWRRTLERLRTVRNVPVSHWKKTQRTTRKMNMP